MATINIINVKNIFVFKIEKNGPERVKKLLFDKTMVIWTKIQVFAF